FDFATLLQDSTALECELDGAVDCLSQHALCHLFGRPWDIALDPRQVVDNQGARWVRSGCRPNAVLRPVLCPGSSTARTKHEPPEEFLGFAVFALRDLKAGEEVIEWEWDNGCVHQLPAILTTQACS
ncbi:hypothetical protein H0H87_001756, partial [Tephrocybe sp. NHM501043]